MFRRAICSPLTPVLLTSLALTALAVTFVADGGRRSAGLETISLYGLLLMVYGWVGADARRRAGLPCFDFGLYLYVLAPVGLFYYCVWSRRWRGLLLFILLMVAETLPIVVLEAAALASLE